MPRLKISLRGAQISDIGLQLDREYIGGRKENCDIRLQAEKGISRERCKNVRIVDLRSVPNKRFVSFFEPTYRRLERLLDRDRKFSSFFSKRTFHRRRRRRRR